MANKQSNVMVTIPVIALGLSLLVNIFLYQRYSALQNKASAFVQNFGNANDFEKGGAIFEEFAKDIRPIVAPARSEAGVGVCGTGWCGRCWYTCHLPPSPNI